MTNGGLDAGHVSTSVSGKDYSTDVLEPCIWKWNSGIGKYSAGLGGFGKFYTVQHQLEQLQNSAVQQFLDFMPSGKIVLHNYAF
ncbi:MAG: hypothetical protein CMN54_08200 [SAR324 cluster bacterium]|uniref:Uncharacterized protein n=1 Tax=SAR324 cluster bacterium TaxID=2024889 RepID=A0A2D6YJN8_9DELT|nr:hypothetical protein [SAR324 cluster bacterium]